MTTRRPTASPAEHTANADAAYDAQHSQDAFPAGYERHFWHRARLRTVTDTLARCQPTRVIDIGCGPGAYVAAIRAAGYDAIGCDPGRHHTESRLAGYVHSGRSFDDMDADALAGIDVALLLDVIEHLANPQSLLTLVRDRLPALRTVIVTVPAEPALWSELDRQAGHVRRYRRDDLAATMAQAGYVVRELRYLFRALYPLALASTWRTHYRRRITAPRWPRLHAAAGRALVAERYVLPDAWPGTSLFCVASPSAASRGLA